MATADPHARALLHQAVATPSPSGRESEAVATLIDALRGRVHEAGHDEVGNLIVRHGHGPVSVTFLGHVDTVPGTIPVEERGGALYGRGSVDAKGALCAAASAVAAIDDAACRALTVRIVGAVGEEAADSIGARHAVRTLPVPDLLIVCEPSGWDAVTLGYKGHLRLRLIAERPAGHSAGPDASAADRIVDLASRYRTVCEGLVGEEAGPFDRVQCTVLGLRHEHDGLRERAEAVLGLRLPPAWSVERTVARLADEPRPAGTESKLGDAVDAVRAPRDGPLQRAFRTAIRAAGGRPRTVLKTGTSDWNVVAPSWRVPTVAYGPGDASLDHAPNEHLDLASYDASVEVLGLVLKRLAAEAVAAERGD